MMTRAQYFGTLQNAIKAFSSVAAAGGCLHCGAFYDAVRATVIGSFDEAINLVETTKKLPEVWGAENDPSWMHHGQIFIESVEGRIRFFSTGLTEMVIEPVLDGKYRVTVVGQEESVRRRIGVERVRWNIDQVERYEYYTSPLRQDSNWLILRCIVGGFFNCF